MNKILIVLLCLGSIAIIVGVVMLQAKNQIKETEQVQLNEFHTENLYCVNVTNANNITQSIPLQSIECICPICKGTGILSSPLYINGTINTDNIICYACNGGGKCIIQSDDSWKFTH